MIGESRKRETRRRWAFTALFVLCSATAVTVLQRWVDPDLFWQLRGGADILKAHSIVLPDSWTYLFQGQPWVNQQWLTEAIFYLFFHSMGYAGLSLMKGLIACAIVLVILGMLKEHAPEVRYACAAVFIAADLHYFIFRTHLFSLLCTAILLFLLERISPGKRLVWIVLLFAVWSNLHALFGLGLFVLGVYVLTRWVQAGAPFTADALRDWISVPLACAATLVNPFGWGVWKTAIVSFGDPETGLISEWWPIWRHSLNQNLGFIFLVLIVVFLAALFPKRIHWPSLLAAASIAVLGILHVRFTADVTLPAVPLLASLLSAARERIGEERVEGALSALLPAFVAGMMIFMASGFSFALAHPITTPGDVLMVDYPVRAVSWMKRHKVSGRIFNEYSWGGYLDWELPESRIFIDGRTGVLLYPRGFLKSWKSAVETRPGWRTTFEKGAPDYALLLPDDYLSAQLALEPGWELLFKDNISALYHRRTVNPTGTDIPNRRSK